MPPESGTIDLTFSPDDGKKEAEANHSTGVERGTTEHDHADAHNVDRGTGGGGGGDDVASNPTRTSAAAVATAATDPIGNGPKPSDGAGGAGAETSFHVGAGGNI